MASVNYELVFKQRNQNISRSGGRTELNHDVRHVYPRFVGIELQRQSQRIVKIGIQFLIRQRTVEKFLKFFRFDNNIAVDRIILQQHRSVKTQIRLRSRLIQNKIDRGGKTFRKLPQRNGKPLRILIFNVTALNTIRTEHAFGNHFAVQIVQMRINAVFFIFKVNFGFFQRYAVERNFHIFQIAFLSFGQRRLPVKLSARHNLKPDFRLLQRHHLNLKIALQQRPQCQIGNQTLNRCQRLVRFLSLGIIHLDISRRQIRRRQQRKAHRSFENHTLAGNVIELCGNFVFMLIPVNRRDINKYPAGGKSQDNTQNQQHFLHARSPAKM